MKKTILLLNLFLALSAGAQLNFKNIAIGKSGFVAFENDAYVLKENQEFKNMEAMYTYKNLRIYMLRANETFLNPNRSIGDYLSLQEAIKSNKIVITEVNGGTVNTLEMQNISKDTIMLLAGEVVTGGKQDRVISQDMIIPPGSGKVRVSVFCVEQGRWSPKTSGNQFTGYYGVSNNSVRKQAVVTKNQHEVWNKVADMNKKNKTETATGTYTNLHTSDALNKEMPEYIKHFEQLMVSDSAYIGFVAVTGDTIISCDMFANHKLFRKQAPQLLRSAAMEAISNGAAVTIAAAKVMQFLSEFMKDETDQEQKVNGQGTLLIQNGKKVHLNYYKK